MMQTMYTEKVCLPILYIWDVDDGQGQKMQFYSREDQVCFPLISVTSGASLMVDSHQPFLLGDLSTEKSGNEETTGIGLSSRMLTGKQASSDNQRSGVKLDYVTAPKEETIRPSP